MKLVDQKIDREKYSPSASLGRETLEVLGRLRENIDDVISQLVREDPAADVD
jgi:hypothetical protein